MFCKIQGVMVIDVGSELIRILLEKLQLLMKGSEAPNAVFQKVQKRVRTNSKLK